MSPCVHGFRRNLICRWQNVQRVPLANACSTLLAQLICLPWSSAHKPRDLPMQQDPLPMARCNAIPRPVYKLKDRIGSSSISSAGHCTGMSACHVASPCT